MNEMAPYLANRASQGRRVLARMAILVFVAAYAMLVTAIVFQYLDYYRDAALNSATR